MALGSSLRSNRLIIPPILTLPVVFLSIKTGIIASSERMMQLIIMIESASPSAQIMIVCMNQLDMPDVASKIAYIYVFEYISSILTITLWSTVAIASFY